MKISKLLLLSPLFLSLLLNSCLTSTVVDDTPLSTDAKIISFNLTVTDSALVSKATTLSTDDATLLKNLDKVYFTIDQNTGNIYNLDSLPAGTTLKKGKLFATISFASASKVMIKYPSGTEKLYATTDSITFTEPFMVEVTAVDGVTKKTYTVKLNIHTKNPNELVWNAQTFDGWNTTAFNLNKTVSFKNEFLNYLNTSSGIMLFKSSVTDGKQWTLQTQNLPLTANLQTITAFGDKLYIGTSDKELYSSADGEAWLKVTSAIDIIGIVGSVTDAFATSHLILISSEGNSNHFVSTTNGSTFSAIGDAALPSDFPLSGFASISKTIGLTEKLTLIGGKDFAGNLLNSVQQMYWDKSGFHCGYNIDNNGNWFSKRQGANAYFYDGKMVLSCGSDATQDFKEVYSSKDNGISWKKETVNILPTGFIDRSFASTLIDSENYIWLFGGLNHSGDRSSANLNEIWRGRLNRYGFIRQ
ncbi:MAG: DUF6242 domain-containing protein [Bacteroidales bacterium]|nr:DUF6242 domain-containing protein [Bacteroidales bacterium]